MIKNKRGNIVIGSASGIGKELVKIILNKQKEVLISFDKQNCQFKKNTNFRHIQIDISNSTIFEKTLKEVLLDFDEVDIYFTAGLHNTFSASEGDANNISINQFLTNYIPHTSLVKILLKLKIKSNIIIACSLSSTLGLPFQQSYSASKAATQYFYESISFELSKNYSRAFIVRLGSVSTGFNSLGNIIPSNKSNIYYFYKNSISKINQPKQIPPKKVAYYFYKLAKSNTKYGTFLKDYGKNSFVLNIIRRIFGYRLTYSLSSKHLLSGD